MDRNSIVKFFKKLAPQKTAIVIISGFVITAAIIIFAGYLASYKTPPMETSAQYSKSPVSTNQLSPNVNKLTFNLLSLFDQCTKASHNEKAGLLKRMEKLAEERVKAIEISAETNPEGVASIVLTDQEIAGLPEELKKNIENQTTKEGTLSLQIEETLKGDSLEPRHKYFLREPNGREYRLIFLDNVPPNHPVGEEISLTGKQLGNMIFTSSSTSPVIKSLSRNVRPAKTTNPIKKVAVILLNYSEIPPVTVDRVREIIFTGPTSTNAYYTETSFGKMTLQGYLRPDGDIFGRYKINTDPTKCDYSSILPQAEPYLQQEGVNLANYDNIVYVFESINCYWAGLTRLPGTTVFVNGISPEPTNVTNFDSFVVAHEILHTYWFHEANGIVCKDAYGNPIYYSPNCETHSYHDPFDVMGYSITSINNGYKGMFHNMAFNKAKLWLASSNIKNVTRSGIYTLSPLETVSGSTQLLKIPKGNNLYSGDPLYLYVDFRQPYGFDNFNPSDVAVNGVNIHVAYDIPEFQTTKLIDMSPGTGFGILDFYDSALQVGNVFEDKTAGVRIQLISISPTEAQVDVSLGNTYPCTFAQPIIRATPGANHLAPGLTAEFTLELTNVNNSSCTPTTYNFSVEAPSGFSYLFSPDALTVASQSIGSTSLQITANADVPIGQNEIKIQATDNAANIVGTGTLYIQTFIPEADPVPPTVQLFITNLGTNNQLPRKNSTDIKVYASDNKEIYKLNLSIDNIEVANTYDSQLTYSWNLRNLNSGSHIVTATASDYAGNITTSTLNVTK